MKLKAGLWIKRITPHENSDESGYLTNGRSYQVLSEKHYSESPNFRNRNGKLLDKVNIMLADDCVIIKDDKGKIGLFGLKNFKVTSKVK
jgi:hypothetical protein